MSFDLKNAGVGFPEGMNKAFDGLIGKIVEVYVDDIIVELKKKESSLGNLKKVFNRLKMIRMKLNPRNAFLEFLLGNVWDIWYLKAAMKPF